MFDLIIFNLSTLKKCKIGQIRRIYVYFTCNFKRRVHTQHRWTKVYEKWHTNIGSLVFSSPAIDNNGTIYIGSNDWYFYAINSNGTRKWRYKTGGGVSSSPAIAEDGTIYVGSDDGKLYAIYPNGTKKWVFSSGGSFWFGASPALSVDGTIFFGVTSFHGGSSGFFAVNTADGTEKWHKTDIGWFETSPAIGENGIVYACSGKREGNYLKGYLYAFGIGELEADSNGPYYGLINQPVQFSGSAKGGYKHEGGYL